VSKKSEQVRVAEGIDQAGEATQARWPAGKRPSSQVMTWCPNLKESSHFFGALRDSETLADVPKVR